jgi:ATP-binding cassette subfamily G (WHITE) protein 2 (SNQ2)
VLVLDKGRQIFLGPPSQARSYFEELGFKSIPRQPTLDYLKGCTDPNERQLSPGRRVADVPVPSTPEALEQAFLGSELAVDLHNELEEYKMTSKGDQEAFKRAVLLDKNRGSPKESPYTLGYNGQVMALARRQFQMRLQDRFQLVTSFSLSVVREHTEVLISSDRISRFLQLLSELLSLINHQHQMAHLLVPASFSSAC